MKNLTKKSLISFLIILAFLIALIVGYILYFIVYRPQISVERTNGWALFFGISIFLYYSLGFILVMTTISFMKYINVYKKDANPVLRAIFSILTIIITIMAMAFAVMTIWAKLAVFQVISLSIILAGYIVIYFISPISFLRRIDQRKLSKIEQIENL
jgi:hypothetical protein